MFSQIDFTPGVVVYNDIELKMDVPLKEQVEHLKEDLLQVNFRDSFLLDVGWYPSFSVEGCFKVMVIRNFNWTEPVRELNVKDINSLQEAVQDCLSLIKSLL